MSQLEGIVLIETPNHCLQVLNKFEPTIGIDGILDRSYPVLVFEDDRWWGIVVQHSKDT